MKSIISISLFLFILSKSFGQIDFKGDSISASTYSKPSLLDSLYKLDKTYDFEFRLWSSPSLVNYSSVFILSQKNKIWSARFFECTGIHKQTITEKPVDQSKLNRLWEILQANQILTLPTQEAISNRMNIYISDPLYAQEGEENVRQVGMSDGNMYYFELAKQNKRRQYAYHSPQAYLKHYPNIEEIYRAYVLIILIRKYLGLDLSVV